MSYVVSPMTLDVILMAAFGVETDVQTNPESELLSRSKRVFQRPSSALVRILPAVPLGWLIRKVIMFFRGQPLDYFREMALRMIDARRQQFQQGIMGRKDLLQLMLTAHQVTSTEEKRRKLSDEEITAQSIVFMLAGHETTSNTICFSAYYLALNPDLQEKLRMEIDAAFEVRDNNLTVFPEPKLGSGYEKIRIVTACS